MDLVKKIEELQSVIKKHEYNFLVLDEKTISSAEMEVLKTELYYLEKKLKNQPAETAAKNNSHQTGSSIEFYNNFFDEN